MNRPALLSIFANGQSPGELPRDRRSDSEFKVPPLPFTESGPSDPGISGRSGDKSLRCLSSFSRRSNTTRSSFSYRYEPYYRGTTPASKPSRSVNPHSRRFSVAKKQAYDGLLYEGSARRSAPRWSDDRPVCNCQPGDIITLPVHTASHRSTVSADDIYQTWSSFGIIETRFRKCVVIEPWKRHVIAIPVFTYGGRGLEGKEFAADEYAHIRDREEVTQEDTELVSKKRAILAARDSRRPRTNGFIKAPAVLHLTNKLTLQNHELCSVEGRLTTDSMQLIVEKIKSLQLRNLSEVYKGYDILGLFNVASGSEIVG